MVKLIGSAAIWRWFPRLKIDTSNLLLCWWCLLHMIFILGNGAGVGKTEGAELKVMTYMLHWTSHLLILSPRNHSLMYAEVFRSVYLMIFRPISSAAIWHGFQGWNLDVSSLLPRCRCFCCSWSSWFESHRIFPLSEELHFDVLQRLSDCYTLWSGWTVLLLYGDDFRGGKAMHQTCYHVIDVSVDYFRLWQWRR